MLKKVILILILFLTSSIFLFSQIKTVEIFHKQLPNGDYVFSSYNKADCDYYLSIDFNTLHNLDSDVFLPFHITVPPGRSQILKLVVKDPLQGTQFLFDYFYLKGCGDCKIDSGFVYVLPFSKNKVIEVSNIVEKPNPKQLSKYDDYTVFFDIDENDTIFAMRGGTVSGFEKYNYSIGNEVVTDDLISVEIYHNDGSFAIYRFFNKQDIFVHKGQRLMVGEPIGILGDCDNYNIDFNVALYYLDKESIDEKILKIRGEWSFIKPMFIANDNTISYLQKNSEYKSTFTDSIYIQDMTKREVRLWKKANKK